MEEVLTPERFRAYLKCSELYHLGGILDSSDLLDITILILKKQIINTLRDNSLTLISHDNYFLSTINTIDLSSYLLPQLQELKKNSYRWLKESTKFFNNKLVMTGSLNLNYKHISIPIIGTFYKDTLVEGVIISPYDNPRFALVDPVVHMAYSELTRLIKSHNSDRSIRVWLHVLGCNSKQSFFCKTIKNINKAKLQEADNILSYIEKDIHRPLLPCPYRCVYKSICFPEG